MTGSVETECALCLEGKEMTQRIDGRVVPGITRRLIMPNWSYTSYTLMGPDANIGLSESHPFCGWFKR
jgi:hypothetical protein